MFKSKPEFSKKGPSKRPFEKKPEKKVADQKFQEPNRGQKSRVPQVTLPSSVVNEAELLKAWEAMVSQLPFDVLKKDIKLLWSRFNKVRDDLPRDYMTQSMNAYMASFFLPNLAKIEMLVRQKAFHLAYLKAYKSWGPEWTIVDFGAGPLTASIAFLKSLNFQSDDKFAPKKIKIIAIEPSSAIVKTGEGLVRAGLVKGVELVVEHQRTLELSHKAHVVLAANALNEIPTKLRTKLAGRFLDVLHPDGLLLIVEPGQDVHSKALSGLRDSMLGEIKKQKRAILAPCFHHKLCPLGPNSKRTDWCWFQHAWHVPTAQHQIDLKTGIDHRELNFSYVLIGAESQRQVRYARVVSDSFQVPVSKSTLLYWQHNLHDNNPSALAKISKLREVSKQLLCTQEGLLTAQLSIQAFTARRGDTIEAAHVGVEVKERTAVSGN